ncbi:DUF4190 domain-containing protein [Amycolatopsis rubida]|uniref:DUF4190 domain-containing protein n=1 Tax=Amycolatopsis rubida TaxID=112413 RepID=A0A1I6AE99_9PSEU|nr:MULTISPECIES: DUF4190 domain-containing protein [Amycolatopsis]MYW92325.1 DUF4190 domain-containing protein [Amycolatopsis rubida]NEC57313.1 DUF4190 domain-containing protein [Amycolatopsis rubida]OAP23811.1 hypothetical protein A4R44_05318 [Amycolatopsis sp. M39]SFQ66972.1 protein of unknown function [Amycolatopsis rubida]
MSEGSDEPAGRDSYEHPSYEHQPYPPQGPPPGAGLAIGSLICSIAGFVVCGPMAVAGIVMGHLAFYRARRGRGTGGALAVAGFVIGYAALIVWGIAVPLIVHALAQSGVFG